MTNLLGFMRLTNAASGRPVILQPAVVADLQERIDPRHPKTKTAIIKTDGTFLPIAEPLEVCIQQLESALANAFPQPSRTMRQSVNRPEDPSDPGPVER